MNNEILQRIKNKLKTVPTTPGVYKMLDVNGNIIYIGKAINLKRRVSSYFIQTKKTEKVAQMVSHVYDFEYTITSSELEALNLESNLIHEVQPFYNILLKDGKAFPYIRIDTTLDYPTIEITRKVNKDKAQYFGPYFNKIDIKTLTTIIENTFKLRNCKNKIDDKKVFRRACLNHSMELCLAPCINKNIKKQYHKEVQKVINFLKGNLTEAKEILTNKMLNASHLQLYEKAIEYRNHLKLIENLKQLNITELTNNIDMDVFGYSTDGISACICLLVIRGGKMVGSSNYSVIDSSINDDDTISNFITQYYINQNKIPDNIVCEINNLTSISDWLNNMAGKKINITNPKIAIKKKLIDMANNNAREYLDKTIKESSLIKLKTEGAMQTLQAKLNLQKLPRRIEGYDISNLQGTNTVASMVVFTNAVANKKHYRKFKIDIDQQNDFLSMSTVIKRRFNEYKLAEDLSFKNLPDLILIDGGLGQLHKAKESLDKAGITVDIISLAKKDEMIYTTNTTTPIRLAKSDYALKLLQNVRDESHRFAITFQKSLRKNTLTSVLNNIKGIGDKTVNILLTQFKNIDNIKNATIDDLKSVSNIGEKTAKLIFEYFNK